MNNDDLHDIQAEAIKDLEIKLKDLRYLLDECRLVQGPESASWDQVTEATGWKPAVQVTDKEVSEVQP